MKRFGFSAPGSVILTGEYAMAFGKPALAVAVEPRVIITSVSTIPADETERFIVDETKNYLEKNNGLVSDTPCRFRITSKLSNSETFGYKDAKTTAIVAFVLYHYAKKPFSNETVHAITYQIEKKKNPKESGIHCTASVFGGLVYYRKEFEFLKNVSSLAMRIPKPIEKNLFVVDTGLEDKTNIKFNEKIINEIEKITKRFVISIAKEDADFFHQCIYEEERAYEHLGIVPERMRKLIEQIDTFGAAKKISRFLLVFTRNENKLKGVVKKNKLAYIPFRQATTGLQSL